ncbi:dimethylsulfoniopropionate lyase DddQ [Shimia gijangensis]|uniref:Dimethylsulfoniopropionate lyase DddQ n=1 Tax=Shimia gijangensis TaxID=1470563 RepID=A0A1M6GPN0_9RHOB|nr:dimethylsulfonioproprionate lyase family protein [Shimia gijangensis]SHJ11894.1 dimethylsulfoniopropionate lyase DddQ [Shimia gijangensis]
MSRPIFDTLLDVARKAHQASTEMTAFCPFPDDIRATEATAFHIPASDLFQAETGLFTDHHDDFRKALVAAAPYVRWRETYKGTDIGQDFLDRFGCYCLIGPDAPFHSDQMFCWMVYMPPGLHYPWHHHPGEEMYLVLGGEAEFFRKGAADETLRSGDVCQHGSNQPHAMETFEHPVLAYVVWRNGFATPPVLTKDER